MRTDVVGYEVHRIHEAHVTASVLTTSGSGRAPLPHLVRHSPTGFEYGYGGSGPADLGRSIIGHAFESKDPAPWLYQTFKTHWLAPLEGDGPHRFEWAEILTWCANVADCRETAGPCLPDAADPCSACVVRNTVRREINLLAFRSRSALSLVKSGKEDAR